MISYSNDPTIRFDHTPVVNKIAFQVNQIGPDDPYVFPEVDYDDTDSNTIYVNSESPGDDSNPGTYSSPKQTLLAAINATTATKTKVVVQDTATIFNEDISGGTFTYLQGVYQEGTGGTSSWMARQLGFTPSDSNAVFVAKTGSDSTGTAGTQADPWLTINAAILDCDTGRDVVVILDSETYEEEGFEFTGNFTGLYAAIGQDPTVTMLVNTDYFEFDPVKSITSVDTLTNPNNFASLACCGMNDGRVVYFTRCYISGAYSIRMKIFDPQNNFYCDSTTTIMTGAYFVMDCKLLPDGNVILLYYIMTPSNYEYRYRIFDVSDWSTVKDDRIVFAGGSSLYGMTGCVNGNTFIIIYGTGISGNKTYADTLDLTTLTLSGAVQVSASFCEPFSCALLDDGNIFLLYDSSNRTYYIVYDTSWNIIVSGTDLVGRVVDGRARCVLLQNGLMRIDYSDVTAGGNIYTTTLDPADWSVVIAETTIASTSRDYPAICETTGSIVAGGHLTTAIGTYTWYIYADSPEQHMIEVTDECTISGIHLNVDDHIYLARYFDCTDICNLKNVELYEATSSTDNTDCTAIYSNSHVDITNSILRDCDIGVDTTEDTSDFFDSQFYRITEGYAIDIDGAAGTGAGINIEHCDFFDCYGGVHLENNDGGEDIKNSIFHDCSVYAIDAETALTITYCCVTSAVTSTVTLGSYVNRGNPDYVNEGYTDPDDIDLNLRVKVLGYPGNSAAYALADDSRNAGAIDVKYIGTETTYTSITVPKPNQMKHEYAYAGATNTQRKDGSWTSFKDGQSEVLTMTWDGIAAAYMTQLITMWKSSEYVVLIYPDPVTYPNSFEQWTLIRESLNNSVGTPTLSDLGAQSVTLKFAKAA